ncbi:MAG: hypothetical protein ACE5JP_07025 [Candidatus Bipolaricaulia bacterium]
MDNNNKGGDTAVLTVSGRRLSAKLLIIAAAIAVAAGLAVLFNSFFEGEAVAKIQEAIVGTGDFSAGPTIAFSLSLVIGITMIVVPCSFPMIFSLSPVAAEAKTTRGWLATMGLFTLGLALPMAAVGALVGGLGFGLRELFTENAKVIAVSLYSAVGSVWYGAALLGVNAIGRVLPLFVIGLLFFSGVRPQTVTHWLTQKRQTVKLVNGIGLTILGAFLLIFWGIIVGLGVGS